MFKPLKFSSSKNRLLWCSDLHMGHNPQHWDCPPLWSSRGFKSIEDHDAWVKDQWFKLVDGETVVVNLGDATFSDPKGERFRQFTTWPGRQLHVWGNHRSGATQVYQEGLRRLMDDFGCNGDGHVPYEIYPISVNNLTFVGDQLHAWIDGVSVYHQQYATYIWPELGEAGLHLMGHSHSRATDLNPETISFGKALDVGLDNAIKTTGTPFFDWPTIQRIMATKPVVKRDHH